MLLLIADFLEKIVIKIKKYRNKRYKNRFLKKYGLKESVPTKNVYTEYNSYEGTNLYLIDELIKSNEIEKTNNILDIGSGTGILLLYLAEHGFVNLRGIEIEESLYEISKKNVSEFNRKFSGGSIDIIINNGDILCGEISDDIDIIILYNTFFGKESYLQLLSLIKESIERRFRKIKLILLYPTVASLGALREADWLYHKTNVISKAQVCWRCLYYSIYETREENVNENCIGIDY